jgi:hypothetical protein
MKADPTIAGVQINWVEDEEIEYLGPAALSGRASCTAASSIRGGRTIYYLYPVEGRLRTPNQLVISYHLNPASWRDSWGWEVCKGDLVIDFNTTVTTVPERISFHHEGSGDIDELTEGEDWVYVPPQDVQQVAVKPRGRLMTSRLARPDQQRLRSLLLSEHGGCQITGAKAFAALEACHIVPVKNKGPDEISNAILLRSDLHALFDAGLIQFRLSGNKWLLHCSPSLQDQQYRKLEGTPLTESGLPSHAYLLARQTLADASSKLTA